MCDGDNQKEAITWDIPHALYGERWPPVSQYSLSYTSNRRVICQPESQHVAISLLPL